jgi:parvulin-like peptidyl-prolyl isomerase
MDSPIPARVAFPWRPFVYAAVLLYLALDLHLLRGPLYRVIHAQNRNDAGALGVLQTPGHPASLVATVNRKPITRGALDRRVLEHFFVRGLRYEAVSGRMRLQARVRVLEEMIDDEMLRQYSRLKPVEVPPELVDRRYAEFVSQFSTAPEFRARLRQQGMSEEDLRREIKEECHQLLWLEAKIAHAIEPGPAEVEQWYAANAGKLAVDEAVRASHIFLSTVDPESGGEEELIKEIHARALAGEDFAKLAKTYSEDPRSSRRGGDLQWFTRARMPQEFTRPVFAIAEGEIGPPFRTPIGWHLVRVVERAPACTPELEEVRDEIAAEIANSRRGPAVRSLLRSMRSRPRIVYYEEAIRAEPAEQERGPGAGERLPGQAPKVDGVPPGAGVEELELPGSEA